MKESLGNKVDILESIDECVMVLKKLKKESLESLVTDPENGLKK